MLGSIISEFRNVLVENGFHLEVEYSLPENTLFEKLNYNAKEGYQLNVRQLWSGESLGAIGIKLLYPSDRKQRKSGGKKKRRGIKSSR